MTGIYKIQSIIHPERFYIGSAKNIYQRWAIHISSLKLNKHVNPKLQAHYNKYGIVDLQFSIILFGCDKEELLIIEQCFLNTYNPWFNICKIAGSPIGTKRSEEFCKKNSELKKGQVSPMKGRHHSEESKRKISKNGGKGNLGKKLSEDIKQKMRRPHKFATRKRK